MDKRMNLIIYKEDVVDKRPSIEIIDKLNPKMIVQGYEDDEILLVYKKPFNNEGHQTRLLRLKEVEIQQPNLLTVIAPHRSKYSLTVTNKGRIIIANAQAIRNSNRIKLNFLAKPGEEVLYQTFLTEEEIETKKLVLIKGEANTKVYSLKVFYKKDEEKTIRNWRQLFVEESNKQKRYFVNSVLLTDELKADLIIKESTGLRKISFDFSTYKYADNLEGLENHLKAIGKRVGKELSGKLILNNHLLVTRDILGKKIIIGDTFEDTVVNPKNIIEEVNKHKISDSLVIENNLITLPLILTEIRFNTIKDRFDNQKESCTVKCKDNLLPIETTDKATGTLEKTAGMSENLTKHRPEKIEDFLEELPEDDLEDKPLELIISADVNEDDATKMPFMTQLEYSYELARMRDQQLEELERDLNEIQNLLTDDIPETLSIAQHQPENFKELGLQIKHHNEIDTLKNHYEEEKQTLKNQHTTSINELKEQHHHATEIIKEQHKEAIKKLNEQHSEKMQELNTTYQESLNDIKTKLDKDAKATKKKVRGRLTRRTSLVSKLIKMVRSKDDEIITIRSKARELTDTMNSQTKKINAQAETVIFLTEQLGKENEVQKINKKLSNDLSFANNLSNTYKVELDKLNKEMKTLKEQLKIAQAKEKAVQIEKSKPVNKVLDKLRLDLLNAMKQELGESSQEATPIIVEDIDGTPLTEETQSNSGGFNEIFKIMMK